MLRFETNSTAFTNYDEVSGKVHLTVAQTLTLVSISVCLEGFAHSSCQTGKISTDTHQVLHDTRVVFPETKKKRTTVTPGNYAFGFSFRVPRNTTCTAAKEGGGWTRAFAVPASRGHVTPPHVTVPLPPTLAANSAQVYYHLRACAKTPLLSSDIHCEMPLVFVPLDRHFSSRASSYHEAFVRHSTVFPRRIPEIVAVRNSQYEITPQDVPFSLEARFQHPPSFVAGSVPKVRLHITSPEKPSRYTLAEHGCARSNGLGVLRVHSVRVELECITGVSVPFGPKRVSSSESRTVVLGHNVFDLRVDLANCTKNMDMYELELPRRCLKDCAIPPDMCPSFSMCNVSRSYNLHITVEVSSQSMGVDTDTKRTASLVVKDVQITTGLRMTREMAKRLGQKHTDGLPSYEDAVREGSLQDDAEHIKIKSAYTETR